MSATEAWKQCGEPRGEKCIQNIRKRARELREKRLLDVVPHRGGTPAAAATPLPLADAEGGEGGVASVRPTEQAALKEINLRSACVEIRCRKQHSCIRL